MARPKKVVVSRQVEVLSRQGLGRLEDGIGCREKSRKLSDATSLYQPNSDEVRAQACGSYPDGTLLPRYIQKPKGEEAEPHIRRAKAKRCGKNPECTAGLFRGTGDDTQGRLTAKPERPSLAAREGWHAA